MADQTARGDDFEKKAEKKLSGWSFFGSKADEAVDLYEKAANCFKLAKNWERAGAVYIKLANCHLKLDSRHEAASAYVDAANCYKKYSMQDAANSLNQAVNLFLEIGRLNMAARYCKELGELYDQEQDIEKAMDYFERAADLFLSEEVTTSANQCKQKVAQFAAQLEQYPKAIELESDKAYDVEKHMISMAILPEETELAALLSVSAKKGNGEKVYEYLLKLRSCLGSVSSSTADILEDWFKSEKAAEFGSEERDVDSVKDVIFTNGGGWHGLGWLGKGRWELMRGSVSSAALCCCCGQRLACVDVEEKEAAKLAESVASLAMERETKSNFNNFQEWLETHADYEAVVDGANVALYQQNFTDGGFSLTQLDTVVRELYKRYGKWPLVILHNKRCRALMENPSNRQLLDTWRAEGALYTTPNGSNDDWYWLYASVKRKSLLVTNDEMRDHIFEILGRSFFPKWKERHQVRYTFVKGNLRLIMPPPYSVVIQESETGSWHVPVEDKCDDASTRVWLCITRPESYKNGDATGLGGKSNKYTTEETQDREMLTAENVNGAELHNGRTMPTTGKRKHRSPSPTKDLVD